MRFNILFSVFLSMWKYCHLFDGSTNKNILISIGATFVTTDRELAIVAIEGVLDTGDGVV